MRRNKIDDSEFDLPMTPLIDVIFILIIFFLVGSTFQEIEKDLEVKLPAGEGKIEDETPKEIVINVRQNGIIVVDGRVTSMEALSTQVAASAKANPDQIVQIRGDQEAYHKYIVRVMSLCHKYGIQNIMVATTGGN